MHPRWSLTALRYDWRIRGSLTPRWQNTVALRRELQFSADWGSRGDLRPMLKGQKDIGRSRALGRLRKVRASGANPRL